MQRIFLLSPAHCGGERAQLLFNERARFDLARRLRAAPGVPLGEVFAFLSGLYFRGKLTYAWTFARPPKGVSRALVITPNDGLWPAEDPITFDALRGFAQVPIDAREERYCAPLRRDAHALARRIRPTCDIVLLGSVASAKYVDLLLAVFGRRLRFPSAFVGRGDMSRGGLLLRCVEAGVELQYEPVHGAVLHGPRPPKLTPRRWRAA